MTTQPNILDADRITTYEPNNATGPFDIGFPIFDNTGADLSVELNGVTQVGNWTLTAAPIPGFWGAPNTFTGSINFTAPITGTLIIEGNRAPRRVGQYSEGRGVPARDQNTELNILTAITREQRQGVRRGLKVPRGEVGPVIPSIAERANKYFGFDSQGRPVPYQPNQVNPADLAPEAIASDGEMLAGAIDTKVSSPKKVVNLLKLIGKKNALLYGVDPRTGTSHRAAIQAFINEIAAAGGGECYFPAVSGAPYLLDTAPIAVNTDNVTITGDGDGTIFRRSNAAYGDTFYFWKSDAAALRGVGMENVFIQQVTNEMTSGAHLRVRNVEDSYFGNVQLHNGSTGLRLDGSARTEFENIWCMYPFGSAGSSAFQIIADTALAFSVATDVKFHNCDFQPAQAQGLYPVANGWVITGADGVYFTNCHANSCQRSLAIDRPTTAQLSGLKFANCWFDQNMEQALAINGSAGAPEDISFVNTHFRGNNQGTQIMAEINAGSGIRFIGCEFKWARQQALLLGAAVTSCEVTGGQFNNNNSLNTVGVGDLVIRGSGHVVNGARFKDARTNGSGIIIDSGATDFVVTNNNLKTLSGMASGNRLIDNSGTVSKVVANNLVS